MTHIKMKNLNTRKTLMLEGCLETRQGEDVGVNEAGKGGEVDKKGQNGGVENTPRLLNMTGDTTLIT